MFIKIKNVFKKNTSMFFPVRVQVFMYPAEFVCRMNAKLKSIIRKQWSMAVSE